MAFIVFEGLDGAGKSTLIQGLEKVLKAEQIQFVTSREPGGTALGEELRSVLLRCQGEAPSPRTELLLYEAGRAQHVDVVIRPALKAGRWILCDRYTASSLAFQGAGRGLATKDVEALNRFATDDLRADLTVLLDLSVEESEKRRSGRDADRMEREASDFHDRIRTCYLQLADENSRDWLVIDSNMKPDQAIDKLVQELKRRKWIAG